MQTMFDKLGDLLSDALEKGEIPKQEFSKSGKGFQDEKLESTFSDFAFISRNTNQSPHKEKPQEPKKPEIPESVRLAMAFISIPEDSDFDSAKKIYREKLMYYHPDRRNDNSVLQKVAKEKTARLLREWKTLEKWYEKLQKDRL